MKHNEEGKHCYIKPDHQIISLWSVLCKTDGERFSTLRYGTVRYGTVRYGTVRYGTVRETSGKNWCFSKMLKWVRLLCT